MENEKITIIAGPCSVDEDNLKEIYEIADIEVTDKSGKKQKAIAGTRMVGLKSRSTLDHSGVGMGIDYKVVCTNTALLMNGGCVADLTIPPSVMMAQKLVVDTGMLVAAEIMEPMVQLPLYERLLLKGKFMPWNAAVDQLGWHIFQMAEFARRNDWSIGLKNPKWVGEPLDQANSPDCSSKTTMENTWEGLVHFAGEIPGETIIIHRGVDVPDKGAYRNAPVHFIARRVKKATGTKLYFDPSHAYGPKMRDDIVEATIAAMQMKDDRDGYLYEGILIEVGTSQTDTRQHISMEELGSLVQSLATFRQIQGRRNTTIQSR